MRVSLITAACLLFALASQAQPGTGGPGPGTQNVPIDGGASIAVAAGAAYAVRRLKQRRASKS